MTIALPPAATPYHRLARTSAHRWWRPVVGTVLVLVGSAVAGIALVIGSFIVGILTGRPEGKDGAPTFGPIGDTALLLLTIALATPVVFLAARWVQARPAGTVSSVVGRLRWRWLAVCLLVALPTILLAVGGGMMLLAVTDVPLDSGEEEWVGWATFGLSAAMLVAFVPLQAAAEEYVCRGWLLQAVGVFFRGPWLAIALQAVLFAAAHGWGTPCGFLDLVVFGVLAGWLTVRTGGLEAAVALHVMNNLVAMGMAAALGVLDSDETATDAPWQFVVVDIPLLLLFTAVVLWLARRRQLAAVSALPDGSVSPDGAPPAAGVRVGLAEAEPHRLAVGVEVDAPGVGERSDDGDSAATRPGRVERQQQGYLPRPVSDPDVEVVRAEFERHGES
jgi:membrane protease YdiL (CAAX protease family)